jgi:hypothetical protein
MKTLIFSSMALVGLLLVGLQHQQLRTLRAENASLQQASAEASQLKADLERSNSDGAQDADEIARLREENRDLLKLRGEINQLRDARAQFEKVSAENQRLVAQAKTLAKTNSKQSMQPITVRIDNLFNRGLGTPEDAVQTYFWAQRDQNRDVYFHSLTPRLLNRMRNASELAWIPLDNFVSLEIVARRDLNATTVQLGIQLRNAAHPQGAEQIIVQLLLQGGEWRVDSDL